MKKSKAIAACAAAACAVAISACALCACGSVDYTTYTYDDFAAMTDKDWDKKEISYQFYSGEKPIDVDIPESHNIYLINMYKDGTFLMWQAGCHQATMSDAAWFDADRHITWAYFGLWTTSENGDIDAYYITGTPAKNTSTVTVETNADWIDVAAFKWHLKATKSGDDYVITQGDGVNGEVIRYIGVNTKAETFDIPFTSWTSVSGDDIKFKTLQSFVDSYIEEEPMWTPV